MLQVHLIDPERLAAIVDRTATRPVGVSQRIALRQEVALLVQRTEGFVADLVIEQHELAEVRSGPVIDVHLPTGLHFLVGACAQRVQVPGTLRLDDKRAEETQYRQFPVVAVGVELPHPFLHVRMDVPFKFLRLARRHDGFRIRGRGRLAGRAHDHAGGLDEQAAILALHRVAKGHLHAVTLIGAEHQRLNRIALKTSADGARIKALFVACGLVLGFLGTDFRDIVRQHVHVARIEIQPAVQRDLDIDHGDVKLFGRRASRTLAA